MLKKNILPAKLVIIKRILNKLLTRYLLLILTLLFICSVQIQAQPNILIYRIIISTDGYSLNNNLKIPYTITYSTTSKIYIKTYIKQECPLDIKIYDIKNNLVKDIFDSKVTPGCLVAYWDLKDVTNEIVIPGIYVIKVNTSKDNITQEERLVINIKENK